MAAIDLNTVRSTIEGRVATELANSPAISVVVANMPFEPTIGSSFVQCLVNFAANEYLTQTVTSSTVNSITGVVTLNILSKSSIGSGANLTIAKRLRDLLIEKKFQIFILSRQTDQLYYKALHPRVTFNRLLI